MNRDQYIEAFRELHPDTPVVVKGNRWEDVETPGVQKPDNSTLASVFIEKKKAEKISELKEKYLQVCYTTDNEYLKELKRKDAGIAKEKDTTDKQAALDRYKNATIEYEEKKMLIENSKDTDSLEKISVEVE